jgi:hypothetical protein
VNGVRDREKSWIEHASMIHIGYTNLSANLFCFVMHGHCHLREHLCSSRVHSPSVLPKFLFCRHEFLKLLRF